MKNSADVILWMLDKPRDGEGAADRLKEHLGTLKSSFFCFS